MVRKFVFILFISVGLFSAGYVAGIKGFTAKDLANPKVIISREVPQSKEALNFSLFWKVWDTLENSYFDKSKIDYSKMVYGAIGGMVSALGDPYTSFLPPQDNKVIEEDLGGSFEGVGIQIGFKGSRLTVVTPLPGSPAEKVGIKAGDFIIGIKDDAKKIDRGTVGINLSEAVKIIRGPSGTKVTLALLRDGSDEPIMVDVVREKVDVPTLMVNYLGENKDIAHVRLLKFGGETDKEWQKVVSGILKAKEVNKIILDLRNNPGGYLEGAVDIAAEFVKVGTTVVVEEKGAGEKKDFKTERIGLLGNYPLVVLVNGGSASASEILAGALRDIKKVKIVGETSFGKGTIQEPLQLDNGAGLHVTVAKWLTPSLFWVNDKGLEPDVVVEDDPKTSEDEQLQKAVSLISKG